MDGKRSVMPDISCCSNQDLNWMWSEHCSSDSSRQCHSVAISTVDRLNGLAWGLPAVSPTAHTARTQSSASPQDSQHCRSSFNKVCHESVAKPLASLKHSGSHVTSSHTVVNWSIRPENWVVSAATRRAAWAQLQHAAYAYTGTISGTEMASTVTPRIQRNLPVET